MKRKQRVLLVILIVITASIVLYCLRPEAFVQVKNVKQNNSLPLEKPNSTPERVSAINKTSKPSCESTTLEKIAGRCHTNCLFEHIRRKDPELVTILMELKTLSKNPKTKVGKFYSAVFDVYPDIPSKERALKQLAAEDSDNAYPAFFLGDFMSSYNETEARTILEEGVRRKSYESYFTHYFRRLKMATIDSQEVYARAIIFNRQLDIHQMNTSVLWWLNDFDEKLARSVALRILKPTFDLKGEFGDILWNREDYLMSRQMLALADSTEDSLLPEYDVEEKVLERYSPGLVEQCHVNAFLDERNREAQLLRRLKTENL